MNNFLGRKQLIIYEDVAYKRSMNCANAAELYREIFVKRKT